MTEYETVTEVERTPEPETKIAKNITRHFKPTNKGQVIMLVMLFVAAGSACMSIYHTAAYLINNGKPFLISAMTAIFIVLFASVGFTAARYFSEQRGFAKIFSLPFVLITCILICYIAFSTTSVSFEQFRDEEAGKVAGV